MFFKSKPSPSFLSRLQGTALVRDALREVETFELEERKKLIAEHEALKERLTTHLVTRAREEAEINIEILKLEARRTFLGERLIELDASGSRVRSGSNQQLAQLTRQIKAGADPRINNFELWSQWVSSRAVADTWSSGPHSKLFMVEVGMEKHVSGQALLAQQSLDRLQQLVGTSLERAQQMRLEALSSDEVLLELESMAAAIRAEFESVPRSMRLPASFLSPLPGVQVFEINDMSEAVQ